MTETRITEDGVAISHTEGQDAPERKTYTVISESGLYKNGVQVDKGQSIELDVKTASAFIEAGDIE